MSKETQEGTVMAYTMYGFGCGRFCAPPTFVAGAPKDSFCGTVGCRGFTDFPPIADDNPQAKVLTALQNDLDAAAAQALPHLSWWSHILCTQFDHTAERAARVLNNNNNNGDDNNERGWCQRWNEDSLHAVGLHCVASRDVCGFGRSRVTHLVLRIFPYDDKRRPLVS